MGNKVNQLVVWTPTLEKIDQGLKCWSKSHPTQDGKRLIIGMVVGGLTQYLTRVQGSDNTHQAENYQIPLR